VDSDESIGRARNRLGVAFTPVSLAIRRIRDRPLNFLLLTVAIGGATALIGWSSVAAARSQEQGVRLALEQLSPDRRAVEVISFHGPGELRVRSPEESALFGSLEDVTVRPQRLLIGHPVAPSADSGVRVVVAQAMRQSVAVTDGRYPTSCITHLCPAVAVQGAFRLGQHLSLTPQLSVVIVGTGAIVPAALSDRSQLGERAVVVASLSPPIQALLARHGLNAVTTAPLQPTGVHGYALRGLITRLREGLVHVEQSNHPGAPVTRATAPTALLRSLADRGDVSAERLFLVAGQGAALVLAFAAFALTARREGSELADEQLATFGASATQRMVARVAELLVPSLLGVGLAIAAIFGAAALIADRRDLPSAFIGAAVPVAALLAMFASALAAAAVMVFASRPQRRSRFSIGAVELAAVVALAAVVWQAQTTGGLTPSDLRGGTAGPVLLVVPALAFFASGVALLRLLPFSLRLAERISRQAPAALRLAFLTAARNPALAAAATTFLAVCLGSALFCLNYRATLMQQVEDDAAFRSGATVRVVEHGDSARQSTVAPLTRYTSVTSEPPTPVLRLAGTLTDSEAGGQRPIEVVGVPATALADVNGFRKDFSPISLETIAARLKRSSARLSGPRLDGRAVRLWARCECAFPRVVVLHLLLPGQQFTSLRLGVARVQWRRLSRVLPAADRNGRLVAIEFAPTYIPAEFDYDLRGNVDVAGLSVQTPRWHRLPPLSNWEGAQSIDGVPPGIVTEAQFSDGPGASGVRFDFNGSTAPTIRPQIPLPEALPALFGPTLRSQAVGRLATVTLPGLSTALPLKEVASADLFPTVVDHPADFAVIDYDSLFAWLNRDRPGVATPSEAWFFRAPKPGFLARLSAPPFRLEQAISLDGTRQRLLHDPLSEGTSQLLLVSAFVAAALAALGMLLAGAAAVNTERVVFAELEALGVAPRTLARSSRLRLMVISMVGVLAGFAGGIASLALIAGLVTVTGTATTPLPPIRAVADWLPAVSLTSVVALASLVSISLIGRRSSAASAGRRLRG
jgi:hypothetical protein